MLLRRTFAAAVLLVLPRAALAGGAEAAPGVHRPEWVIWAALGTLMLLLIAGIALSGKGLKKGGKGGHPYL